MKKKHVDIITLGCSKNLVDAERLMRQLEGLGLTCAHDASKPQGEIAIISTCGFINDAKEESINTILQFVERKKKKQLRLLYVIGCLSERYLADLEEEIPQVDKYYGKFNFLELINDLKKEFITPNNSYPLYERSLTTPQHYAYLKISEGCNRFCSYCAIPLITGQYKSRPIEEIVAEVKWLVTQGVTELQVIAQDLTYYGTDLYGEQRIAQLITAISDVKGIRWIRLHYAYPTNFPLELLEVIKQRDNVCKYLDIALQHSTDHMLNLMRRHITQDEQTQLINTIRQKVPDIHLRTTIMVGHPNETEEDFQQLLQWISKMKFERLGAFTYSHEDGTYAYQHYQDNIPQDIKDKRLEKLMSIQETIAAQINNNKIGQTLIVVIDREDPDFYIARTQFDSPEVDGEVLIKKNKQLQIGQYYQVQITDTDTFDLYATPL